MILTWSLLAAALICMASIFWVLHHFGEGEDKVVSSRRQPAAFNAIMTLAMAGVVLAIAALGTMHS